MTDNHLYPMTFIAKRIDMSLSASYTIFKPFVRGYVSSASVIQKLNESRINGDQLQSLPADLSRIEKVAVEVFKGCEARTAVIKMRRLIIRLEIRHYRINSHTILVSRSEVKQALSSVVSRKEVVL